MAKKISDIAGGTSVPIEKPGTYKLFSGYVDDEKKVSNGDHAGAKMVSVCWENEDGQSVWDNLPVIENAAFKWAQLWLAMGLPDTEAENLSDITGPVVEKLHEGTRVWATVDMRTYNGKTSPKIAEYLQPEIAKHMDTIQDTAEDEEEVPF